MTVHVICWYGLAGIASCAWISKKFFFFLFNGGADLRIDIYIYKYIYVCMYFSSIDDGYGEKLLYSILFLSSSVNESVLNPNGIRVTTLSASKIINTKPPGGPGMCVCKCVHVAVVLLHQTRSRFPPWGRQLLLVHILYTRLSLVSPPDKSIREAFHAWGAGEKV